MANIPVEIFEEWVDGDTINATEYKKEREIIRTAVNDNYARLIKTYKTVTSTGITKATQNLTDILNTLIFKEGDLITLTLDNTTSTLTIAVVDGAVTTAKLADDSVTAAKLATDSVTEIKIANGSVTTTKLSDGLVTTAKIADNSITTNKLVNNSITSSKIADNSITTNKIEAGALDGRYYTEEEMDASLASKADVDDAYTKAESDIRYPLASKVLETDNTTPFTPTEITHPATKGYVDDVVGEAATGAIVDGSITDVKLSNTAGQIKARFISHLADNSKQVPHLGTTTNAGNVYTVVTAEVLAANQKFTIKINAASTGAATLTIASLGVAKAIKKAGGADATLKIGVYTFFYDGVNFQLLGEGGEYGTAIASDILAPKTIGTDAGLVVGTMVDRGTVNITPSASNQTIAAGKHSGSGSVAAVTVPVANVLTGTTIAGQAGTMPNRAGDTAALASSVSGTILKLRASNGYRDGVDDNVTLTDANFIAANILLDKTVHGLAGTAQPKLRASGSGTANGSGVISVTGLSFTPKLILIKTNATSGLISAISYCDDIALWQINNRYYPLSLSQRTGVDLSSALTVSGGSFSCSGAGLASQSFEYVCYA